MKFMKIVFFAVVLCLSISNGTEAQSRQNGSNQEQEPIKLSSTLVQVPVIVSDKGGRYITDLKVKDFKLFEDGVEQEISFFGSIEEPFHVAILLDSSGSTVEQLEMIKRAAIAFIDSLRLHDEVMVISFNDSVQIQCEMTGDRDVLKRAVRAIRPGEYTQVYEAVYTAVWEKLNKKESENEKNTGKVKDKGGNSHHPSRDLLARQEGFGIAAGYEKSYKSEGKRTVSSEGLYGAIPHSGYYGSGIGLRPFKTGQAGFNEEIAWYTNQYGDETGRGIKGKDKK